MRDVSLFKPVELFKKAVNIPLLYVGALSVYVGFFTASDFDVYTGDSVFESDKVGVKALVFDALFKSLPRKPRHKTEGGGLMSEFL